MLDPVGRSRFPDGHFLTAQSPSLVEPALPSRVVAGSGMLDPRAKIRKRFFEIVDPVFVTFPRLIPSSRVRMDTSSEQAVAPVRGEIFLSVCACVAWRKRFPRTEVFVQYFRNLRRCRAGHRIQDGPRKVVCPRTARTGTAEPRGSRACTSRLRAEAGFW